MALGQQLEHMLGADVPKIESTTRLDSARMGSVKPPTEDGWWECVVLKREDELLTLRLRDYPKQGTYLRHVTQVALINPGPE